MLNIRKDSIWFSSRSSGDLLCSPADKLLSIITLCRCRSSWQRRYLRVISYTRGRITFCVCIIGIYAPLNGIGNFSPMSMVSNICLRLVLCTDLCNLRTTFCSSEPTVKGIMLACRNRQFHCIPVVRITTACRIYATSVSIPSNRTLLCRPFCINYYISGRTMFYSDNLIAPYVIVRKPTSEGISSLQCLIQVNILGFNSIACNIILMVCSSLHILMRNRIINDRERCRDNNRRCQFMGIAAYKISITNLQRCQLITGTRSSSNDNIGILFDIMRALVERVNSTIPRNRNRTMTRCSNSYAPFVISNPFCIERLVAGRTCLNSRRTCLVTCCQITIDEPTAEVKAFLLRIAQRDSVFYGITTRVAYMVRSAVHILI